MSLPRLSLLLIPTIMTGCFLMDKIDDLDGDDPDKFDPGTTPVSQAFSVLPSQEIRLKSLDGVGLTIPPNSLQTEEGLPPVSASITLTRYIFDLSHPWNMPGSLLAQNAQGLPGALTSFGAIEIIMKDMDGNPLDLANGVTAEITIPALDGGPTTLPLWYYEETLGLWIEDGIATKIDDNYVGTVSHFTKWNADIFANRACITGAIIDDDGFPVGGTIVTAELTNAPGLSGDQVFTDADGAYLIEGLSGGATYKITGFGYDASDSVEVTLPVSGTTCVTADVMVLKYGALGADEVNLGIDPDSDGETNGYVFAGSCDSVASQGICVDYSGTSFTAQGVQSACAGYNPPATYSVLPCSRSSAHGVCTLDGGQVTEIEQIYDATYYTLENATTACSLTNGVWTPL